MDNNITKKQNAFISEEEKTLNWEEIQATFKKTFGMTVPEFYERLSKYKRKDLKKILPSKSLKIQDIFS